MSNKVSLSKSVSFAIEMVRACLPHTPTDVRLDGRWVQMNAGSEILGDERFGYRLISLLILIDPSIYVSASCTVNRTDGVWTSGEVNISFPDERGRNVKNAQHWEFCCELNAEGKIDVRPAA